MGINQCYHMNYVMLASHLHDITHESVKPEILEKIGAIYSESQLMLVPGALSGRCGLILGKDGLIHHFAEFRLKHKFSTEQGHVFETLTSRSISDDDGMGLEYAIRNALSKLVFLAENPKAKAEDYERIETLCQSDLTV
ncbi:MAG: hypothetical protein AABX32_02035 [Nanoarchaeota archaeon]